MDWIRGIIGLLALVYVLQAWIFKSKNKKQRFPPGPRGFPILGSLHMLGELPHRDLHRLAHKHGDIMYMRLGLSDVVVASSPRAAELFLKTHDLNFASRPPTEAAKHISYGQSGLSFGGYGAYWRTTRKMCSLELLSNQKINSFKSMRKEELALLTKFIQEAASDRTTVDLSGKVSALTADMSCLMVFGKKYEDNEFDERGMTAVMQEGMHLAATPNLGDFIPFIVPLDLQGLTKRMKGVSKVFDAFFEKIIDAHIQSTDQERTKDFVDVMLGFMGSEESEYRVERSNIKAIILDMLAGATDTSATAVEWTLSELIKHPRVMKKLQKELETVVGMERPVDESDLQKLAYLDMVLKESMRLHPVAPLMIPHAAIEDCNVDGFHVPRNSRVLINVWAIGRDPSAWTDANKFIPERFDGSDIDFRGRDFQFLPFGSGRRGCPGMQLGLVMVQLVVAQLVHCFDWELPNNMLPTELDMTEEFGLTVPRAKHLLAVPTYRLQH